MGSFYQNGLVANLHDFSYGVQGLNNYERLENDLKIFSKKKIQWNLFCRVCTQSLKEKLFQK